MLNLRIRPAAPVAVKETETAPGIPVNKHDEFAMTDVVEIISEGNVIASFPDNSPAKAFYQLINDFVAKPDVYIPLLSDPPKNGKKK